MRVEIRDLWKRYPGTWALQDISLTVETGRVLGVASVHQGRSYIWPLILPHRRNQRL